MNAVLILAASLVSVTNVASKISSSVPRLMSKMTSTTTNLASTLVSTSADLASKVSDATTDLTAKLASNTNVTAKTDKLHQVMRANPPELTPFLPNHELLERQPDTFPFHYYYSKGNLAGYKRVCVAPVDSKYLRESSGWSDLDKQMAGQFGNDVDALLDFMQNAYRQAFEKDPSGRFSVTDDKDQPDTLIVEPALIAVVPSKAELQAAGMVASALVFPGLGAVASATSAGSIVVECRVRDARTGEIVAMYADAEKDPNAVIATARLTWSYSSRINVKAIAAMTVKLLAAEDVKAVRRDFPLRLAALIKDAQLDESRK